MNLFNEVQELINKLNVSITSLAKNGRALAEAEREYKIILRQKALELRQEKGMPVTLIQQIVYGVPDVAKKRFERDVAEAMYLTNQEHINTTKLQIRVLESQLSREWSNTK